jgi:ribosomal protein S12 methylthiotransferase accessory factor
MSMKITFPGGPQSVAVDAEFKGFTFHTDQPKDHGGGGTGPAPFDFFLASIGTCAGLYVLRFCQQRGLSTKGLGLTLDLAKAPDGSRIDTVRLQIHLPDGFPEKYRDAVIRAADQCAVKRHILEPPRFEVTALAPVGAV